MNKQRQASRVSPRLIELKAFEGGGNTTHLSQDSLAGVHVGCWVGVTRVSKTTNMQRKPEIQERERLYILWGEWPYSSLQARRRREWKV